eukprot:314494-Rhodomonas_salina.1
MRGSCARSASRAGRCPTECARCATRKLPTADRGAASGSRSIAPSRRFPTSDVFFAPCRILLSESHCVDSSRRRRYLVPPFVGLLLLIAWYYFAWRPLLQSESSIETYMMAGCMACSSLPLFSMLTKTVDLFKKLGSAGGKGGGGGGHIQMVFKIIVGYVVPSHALSCMRTLA